MAVPKGPARRGLKDLRTMTDTLTATSNPQRKHLKLAMLHMEKARKRRERQSAKLRIGDIDTRVAEIDRECAQLNQMPDTPGDAAKPTSARSAPDRRVRIKY